MKTVRTKSLAVKGEASLTPGSISYTRDQIDLLKRTVAKGADNDEFALFMHVAQRTGLDPFRRQLYAVKRWSAADRRETMVIQTGIDGYRVVAQRWARQNKLSYGYTREQWCDKSGQWRDVWLSESPPSAARVVITDSIGNQFQGVATYGEYVQTKKDGSPTRFWSRMPSVMLLKCAEAIALRKMAPEDLSSVYIHEEMMQADSDRHLTVPTIQAKQSRQLKAAAGPEPVEDDPGAAPPIEDESSLSQFHEQIFYQNREIPRVPSSRGPVSLVELSEDELIRTKDWASAKGWTKVADAIDEEVERRLNFEAETLEGGEERAEAK